MSKRGQQIELPTLGVSSYYCHILADGQKNHIFCPKNEGIVGMILKEDMLVT